MSRSVDALPIYLVKYRSGQTCRRRRGGEEDWEERAALIHHSITRTTLQPDRPSCSRQQTVHYVKPAAPQAARSLQLLFFQFIPAEPRAPSGRRIGRACSHSGT